MSLELSKLTSELPAMGADLASRARAQASLVTTARRWLAECAAHDAAFRKALAASAREIRAAIPTSEPVDTVVPDPVAPHDFTAIGVDGSQIEPDRHGIAYYHLLNVGSLVYRHGSGGAPEPSSEPKLGYAEADLYEGGSPVTGNLLDVRRDLAEITRVAHLCEAEARRHAGSARPTPTVALVDGTLLLWVLEERSNNRQREKAATYVAQMDRVRASGATLGAFTSRPRRTEVTRLLHLAHVGGVSERVRERANPLEHVPDRAVFAALPPGARSALFLSPSRTNLRFYAPAGHAIYYCYINVAEDERQPVVARVEMPEWVAHQPGQLRLLHGAIVAQARITGDYPYVLARADELAFITGSEREMLNQMVSQTLLREGLRPELSPKANQKSMTRAGWRRR
jgi:hypothetical protein